MKGLVAVTVVAVAVVILIGILSRPKAVTTGGATLDGLSAQVTR